MSKYSDHPGKRGPKPGPGGRRAKGSKRNKQVDQSRLVGRATFLLAAVTVVALVLTGLLPKLTARSVDIPDAMFGVWVTDEPKYAERSFEIQKGSLTLQIGEDLYVDYTISRVERRTDLAMDLYTIHYLDANAEPFELAFYYTEDGGGEIRFKNQRTMVWRKQPEPL